METFIMKKMIITAILANAFLVSSVSAASITWDYNFKTTPDGGSGSTSPVATLSLEDVTNVNVDGQNVNGVKFTLSNLGTSKYNASEVAYINGLFLNASSASTFETQWESAQLPGGTSTVTEVEFGEDEHPNQYDYSIEVNFEKGTLKDGGNVSWVFYNVTGGTAPAVSDFLFAGLNEPDPRPDGSYPQDVWSTIKIRGVDANQGELVFKKETVHVVASADIDALFNWAESNFPQYFSSHAESQHVEGYYARHYPGTNIYLGTKDGKLYAYGEAFGGLLEAGDLEGWLLKSAQ